MASRPDPRRRLLALGALLLLSLGMAGALALQSIRVQARSRATARRTLHDYADFAAFILASHAYRQIGSAVQGTLGDPGSWLAGNAASRIPAGFTCPDGNTWFEQDPPATGPLRFAGATPAPRLAAFLADTLRDASRLLNEVGWRFRWIRLPNESGAQGIFIATRRLAPGHFALRGLTACLDGAGSPFASVLRTEPSLPPSVTGARPADSLLALSVASGATIVFASRVHYDSALAGAAVLGPEFGDLAAHVALRADLADRLIIGGVPSATSWQAMGLLAVSALLLVTALLQLRRELELIAIRSDFVANVSHELRTPLTQMLIFTELLRLKRLRSDAERERALGIIDQEVRRLIRLVGNVLQFSGGARRRARELVELPVVARETLEAFRPLADTAGVTLHLEAPDQANIAGDPSAVKQILVNLLDNALKYGPPRQDVRVAIAVLNGRTVLSVEDQGPGVPSSERERVFEEFYRLPRERDAATAGSGIGLAVVRTLVTDMHGAVRVEDGATGGARFVVEFDTAALS